MADDYLQVINQKKMMKDDSLFRIENEYIEKRKNGELFTRMINYDVRF